MRWFGVLVVCLVCSLGVGCQENLNDSQAGRNLDAELVNTLNNLGVENAVVAQHTLYPYHFVANGEELNELGHRDLAVLARHFTEHEGTLNVRRGEIAPELYQARLTFVIDALKEAGVDTARMVVADGMPGGEGMASERVVTILEKGFQGGGSAQTTSSTSTGMMTR